MSSINKVHKTTGTDKGEKVIPPHPEGGYDQILFTGRDEHMYVRAGRLHREDGPAIVWVDGTQLWYFDGRLHREGGPAVIHPDGRTEHFTHGVAVKAVHFDDDGKTIQA